MNCRLHLFFPLFLILLPVLLVRQAPRSALHRNLEAGPGAGHSRSLPAHRGHGSAWAG